MIYVAERFTRIGRGKCVFVPHVKNLKRNNYKAGKKVNQCQRYHKRPMVGRIVPEKVDTKNVTISHGTDDGEQGQKDGDSQVIVPKFLPLQGGHTD